MLRHAFYWRSGGTVEDASLWQYVSGWGRRGDASVIALEDGFPIGAAWFRLFTRDEPGFGFVDDQTPEVAIAVVPSRRGSMRSKRSIARSMESKGPPRSIRALATPPLSRRAETNTPF